MASLKKRGKFFSVQFWWDGKQYIKPLRLEDETEAERVGPAPSSATGVFIQLPA